MDKLSVSADTGSADPAPAVALSSAKRAAAAPAARAVPWGLTEQRIKWIKLGVFCAGLYPFARWIVFGLTQQLGVNPVEFLTRSSGLWTLVLLCITLAITPMRRLTGIPQWVRLRRMLGLFAFFYGAIHFTTYFWFDQWFDLTSIWHDVVKRPFITVGFGAFVLMTALAVTSPRAVLRRLGGKRWQALHRAIYAIAVLAILHFWWMKAGKHDLGQPKLYAAIVAVLLGIRVVYALMQRAKPTLASR